MQDKGIEKLYTKHAGIFFPLYLYPISNYENPGKPWQKLKYFIIKSRRVSIKVTVNEKIIGSFRQIFMNLHTWNVCLYEKIIGSFQKIFINLHTLNLIRVPI